MLKLLYSIDWSLAKDILLCLSSVTGILIAFVYRRKDIYNQLLKEQISAAYFVMSDILELTQILNESYKKNVGRKIGEILEDGEIQEDKIAVLQTLLFIEIQPQYSRIFQQIMARGFIFPEHIQKLISDYFEKITRLFEEENNADLGMNLMHLYDNCGDITDKFNYYFKIDRLSKRMNRML